MPNHEVLLAKPAAATNGRSGRQQLDAATALAKPAALVSIVLRPVLRLPLATAITLLKTCDFAMNGLPDQLNAWRAPETTLADIGAAAEARSTT